MRITIARRLWLLIGIETIALLCVGAIGLICVKRLNDSVAVANTLILPRTRMVNAIQDALSSTQLELQNRLLATDDSQMIRAEEGFKVRIIQLREDMRRYQDEEQGDPVGTQLAADCMKAVEQFQEEANRVVDFARKDETENALNYYLDVVKLAGDDASQAIRKLLEYNEARAKTKAADADTTQRQAALLIAIGVALSLASTFILSVMMARKIGAGIRRVQCVVRAVQSSNDFTLRIPIVGSDELSVIAQSFNDLLENVQSSLKTMASHARLVARASARVASSSDELASGASGQSEAAAAMAVSVQDMASAMTQISDRAQEASAFSGEAGTLAKTGESVINQTVRDINEIEDVVNSASATICELGERSESISKVVGVIREVADQTNLLALNAAIEAARAGEQGRGFAVVADEVRKLAERTANATREIFSMVEGVRRGASASVESMNLAVSKVGMGVARAQDASLAIAKIGEANQRSMGMVAEISQAIQAQRLSSDAFKDQIETVAQTADKFSEAAGAGVRSAHELDSLAEAMRSLVATYGLGEEGDDASEDSPAIQA